MGTLSLSISERSTYSDDSPTPMDLLGKDLFLKMANDALVPSLSSGSSCSSPASSDRSPKGHFITWNSRAADTIFVSSKLIDECLTNGWKPRMKVTCTIQGIGPDYVQADKQHPFTKKVEYVPEEKVPVKQSHFFNLATGSKWNRVGRQGWQKQGGVKSKSAMDKTRMMDRMARRRGGKPNSNFVFTHSNRDVESSDVNPMAIGRSDTVKCWRK